MMALTGAERQRRHREKMRAEGRPAKPKNSPPKTSTEMMMERRRKATERQRRRRQRLRDLQVLCAGHPAQPLGDAARAYVLVKGESDVIVDADSPVPEHQLEAGQLVFKQEPGGRLFAFESGGAAVEAMPNVVGESSGTSGEAEGADDLTSDQSGGRGFEEEEAIAAGNAALHRQLAEGHRGSSDSGGHVIRTEAGEAGVSYTDQSDDTQTSFDAYIAQQRLERKRWFAAERQRKRRTRLRAEGTYQAYRQKHNAVCGKNRARQKELEKDLPDRDRKEQLARRREDTRLRVARHRERKRGMMTEEERQPNSLPAAIDPEELRVVHQTLSTGTDHYTSVNHRLSPGLEVHIADPRVSSNYAPLPQSMVPYALQTVECQTLTTTGVPLVPGRRPAISARAEDKDLAVDRREEDDATVSSAPAVDIHGSRRYMTPPVWPCTRRFHIGQGPSRVTSMLSENDSERQGTSHVDQALEVYPHDVCETSLARHAGTVLGYPQTQSSQATAEPSDMDSVHIELVTEFDQDRPYACRQDISLGLDSANMPPDLRMELHRLQYQLPLVHDYIKKLQSDVLSLGVENQQLRERTLCLNAIKTNNSDFQFWTGFPSYDNFRALFEVLEPSIEPATCPRHSTPAPSPEEEFFYVLVRLRAGLFMKDIAARVGISEADYALIFHRWITALLHQLQGIFRVAVGEEAGQSRHHATPAVTSSTDCTKVLVDCTCMLSEESVRKWKNADMEPAERCKFAMDVSVATGTVVGISDLPTDDVYSQSVSIKLSHLHSTIVGLPGNQGVQSASRRGPAQAHHDCLVKIVNHIRSFHILDNYQMKLNCETFRAVFKVCALLSNVMR